MKRRLPVAAPSPLPPLYAGWMDSLFRAPVPEEPHATCDDCAMGEPQRATDVAFEASIKCCTYLPELPNYLVGRVLAGDDGHGRRSVEARIDRRLGATPLGLATTPEFFALYKEAMPAGMGRTPQLRCPHLDEDARCGIWLHRNAACTSWFCKHVRGAVAWRFWREGLEALLMAVERALARHCIAELDIGEEALLEVFPRPREMGDRRTVFEPRFDRVEPDAYARRWGKWSDRERAFYVACARIVEPLAWNDVLAVAGPEVRLLATRALSLHRALHEETLPERLRLGDLRMISASDGAVRLEGYNPFDPIEVPSALVAVLHRFDGRPVGEIRATLAQEDGIELDDELLRALVDFGVLSAAP